VQGAGSRLAFSYARDGALPASKWISTVHRRFKTPVNALLGGAVVTALFVLLEFASPSKDTHILWFTYPANVNVLVSLVSFGVSGIYLSFLLTVIGAAIARGRGWVPTGKFTLGRWAWPVIIVAGLYLLVMLVNVVAPTGLTSPRGYFNLDWITLIVMIVVAIVGVVFFLVAHSGRNLDEHRRDGAEEALAGTAPPETRDS
jgi:amino acid transporter